jgi:hypothetical protein
MEYGIVVIEPPQKSFQSGVEWSANHHWKDISLSYHGLVERNSSSRIVQLGENYHIHTHHLMQGKPAANSLYQLKI